MVLKNKLGTNILTGNVIFIILNLVFLSILILFIVLKSSSGIVYEERYSKQIALMLDAAKPGVEITMDMSDILDKLEEGWKIKDVVNINRNVVTVKLGEGPGFSYSFFSDLRITNKDYELAPNGELFIGVPK